MASKGLLGRVAGALGRMLLQKERVGTAPGGLSYYRRTERNDHGEEVEKRWVKFPASSGHGFYDPAAIAPEWSQVLRCLPYDRRPKMRHLHGLVCCPRLSCACTQCNCFIHDVWLQWLNHARREPPTEEDIAR